MAAGNGRIGVANVFHVTHNLANNSFSAPSSLTRSLAYSLVSVDPSALHPFWPDIIARDQICMDRRQPTNQPASLSRCRRRRRRCSSLEWKMFSHLHANRQFRPCRIEFTSSLSPSPFLSYQAAHDGPWVWPGTRPGSCRSFRNNKSICTRTAFCAGEEVSTVKTGSDFDVFKS